MSEMIPCIGVEGKSCPRCSSKKRSCSFSRKVVRKVCFEATFLKDVLSKPEENGYDGWWSALNQKTFELPATVGYHSF